MRRRYEHCVDYFGCDGVCTYTYIYRAMCLSRCVRCTCTPEDVTAHCVHPPVPSHELSSRFFDAFFLSSRVKGMFELTCTPIGDDSTSAGT